WPLARRWPSAHHARRPGGLPPSLPWCGETYQETACRARDERGRPAVAAPEAADEPAAGLAQGSPSPAAAESAVASADPSSAEPAVAGPAVAERVAAQLESADPSLAAIEPAVAAPEAAPEAADGLAVAPAA